MPQVVTIEAAPAETRAADEVEPGEIVVIADLGAEGSWGRGDVVVKTTTNGPEPIFLRLCDERGWNGQQRLVRNHVRFRKLGPNEQVVIKND